MSDKFCAFILTHGRPDRISTLDALRRGGYTGEVRIIIDNEDETAEEYRRRYGGMVVMFDKAAAAAWVDAGDNSSDTRAVVFARNVVFDIAEQLGFKYFLQLDDDYRYFAYVFDEDRVYRFHTITNLDAVFAATLAFYKSVPALSVRPLRLATDEAAWRVTVTV